MNFIRYVYSNGFGLQTLIAAAIVAALELLLKRYGTGLKPFLVNYLPFFTAIVCAAACEFIVNGALVFSEETLYSGITSYSVGTIIAVSISKIFRGETESDALISLIAGITESVCKDNVCTEIAAILARLLPDKEEEAVKSVAEVISESKKDGVSQTEILAAAKLILLTVKNLKKETE